MMNSYEIKRLILTNFRSYDKLKLDCEGIKNIIITGENGAGKTNILEAISMLSISGPFRKAKLSQLGRINSEHKLPQMMNFTHWEFPIIIKIKMQLHTIRKMILLKKG